MRTQQEKFELIFDYLTGQVENQALVEELVASDEQARAVYEGLRRTFARLDCYGEVSLPVGLADRAVNFVHISASGAGTVSAGGKKSPEVVLHHRDFGHESRLMWVMGNFRDLFAVAACLLMVFLVGKPGLEYSRQLSRKVQCEAQLAEVGSSFSSYAADNNGDLPQVAQSGSSKWWNIGEQDPDAGSNTQHVYKMVRDGYIRPDRFICPSGQDDNKVYAQVSSMTNDQARSHQDFLSRNHVNYSFKLIVPGGNQKWGISREAIAADKNPIFADFDSKLQNVVSVPNGSKLRTINSHNHNGGQVVLFSDGSVIFMKDRFYGPQRDDIFTIKKAVEYFGTEKPESDDTFIAP